MAREPLYVSESIPALRMIELFRSSGMHMAMVVDEYGSLEGLVTPTDILTGIAGDLPDVGDEDAPGAVAARGRQLADRRHLPVHAAARVLDADDAARRQATTPRSPGWSSRSSATSRTPGENVTRHGWCFEVVDLDGRRIDKVLARRPAPRAQDSGPM